MPLEHPLSLFVWVSSDPFLSDVHVPRVQEKAYVTGLEAANAVMDHLHIQGQRWARLPISRITHTLHAHREPTKSRYYIHKCLVV